MAEVGADGFDLRHDALGQCLLTGMEGPDPGDAEGFQHSSESMVLSVARLRLAQASGQEGTRQQISTGSNQLRFPAPSVHTAGSPLETR